MMKEAKPDRVIDEDGRRTYLQPDGTYESYRHGPVNHPDSVAYCPTPAPPSTSGRDSFTDPVTQWIGEDGGFVLPHPHGGPPFDRRKIVSLVEKDCWLCVGIDGGGTKTKAVATLRYFEDKAAEQEDCALPSDACQRVGRSCPDRDYIGRSGKVSYYAVGQGEAGSANSNSVGKAQAVRNVVAAARAAIATAIERHSPYRSWGAYPVSICLSTSGVDREGDEIPFVKALSELAQTTEKGGKPQCGDKTSSPEQHVEHRPGKALFDSDNVAIRVVNDAYAAVASGVFVSGVAGSVPPLDWFGDSLEGMALIVGTGTIAFGVRGDVVMRDGREVAEEVTARVSGWGPAFGDSGSGYDVGYSLLCAVARCHDGRDRRDTSLTVKVLEKLGLTNPEELINWAYSHKDWASMASLAPLCLEAAEEGDPVAQEILEKCANNLAHTLCVLKSKLFKAADSPPIVLVGGLMSSDNVMGKLLETKIRSLDALKSSILVHPTCDAAMGAAALAQKWASKENDDRLRKTRSSIE